MIRVTMAVTALAAAVLAATPAAAAPDGRFSVQSHQIVCESTSFRRAECPADARGGVRLLQQTGGLCTPGRTWGATQRGVWVTNGCRAIFAVTPGADGGPPPPGRLVVCASWQYRPAHCAAPLRRPPRIEVIAGTCRQGKSWGWSRTGVWVDHGCRARFLIG